jgi:hypothetical protein
MQLSVTECTLIRSLALVFLGACYGSVSPPASLSSLTVVDVGGKAPAGGYLGGSVDGFGPSFDGAFQVRVHPRIRLDVQSQTMLYGPLAWDDHRPGREIPWAMSSLGAWFTPGDLASKTTLSLRAAAALGGGDLFGDRGVRGHLVAGGELALQVSSRYGDGSRLTFTYAVSPTTMIDRGHRQFTVWNRVGLRADIAFGHPRLVIGLDLPLGIHVDEHDDFEGEPWVVFGGPRFMMGAAF